jgi:gamma-glutamyltranspeptidase/glutathione hydrolase
VGTWALALQRFGTLSLAQVLQPAIELAEEGFPLYAALRRDLAANAEKYRQRYPTTGEVYLLGGRVPEVGERVRNPGLAWTLRTMAQAEAEHAGRGRITAIQAGRDAFYRGAVAERLLAYARHNPVEDASGSRHTALLDADDLSEWQAEIETPLSLEFHGLEVFKCPAWTQGPAFLQHLALLKGFDLVGMGLNSAEYLHILIETGKLAFADREAHYGDDHFDPARFDVLLSEAYNAARRGLVGPTASLELRPGDVGDGLPDYVEFDVRLDNRRGMGLDGPGNGTGAKAAGDTTHLDVIDHQGNMVAATPSGGWIGSSPVIPGLGFPLGTRGQVFYLNPRRPNALAPHKRPRATLTPSMATLQGEPYLAFGMRGGDMQDQKTVQFFLAHTLFGLDVQAALDVPAYEVQHFPSSFYPRLGLPGRG